MNKKIETPVQALYLSVYTAQDLGLRPEDIVPVEQHNNYVFLKGKSDIMDLRAIQEEMKHKRHGVDRPIVSVSPDGKTPTLLVADNAMEPEEVQDVLGEKYEKDEKILRQEANKRNIGNKSPVIDTAWVRHVNGLPPAQQFDPLFRQALADRVSKHKANMVSDPPRDPWAYAKDHDMIPPKIAVPDMPGKQTKKKKKKANKN